MSDVPEIEAPVIRSDVVTSTLGAQPGSVYEGGIDPYWKNMALLGTTSVNWVPDLSGRDEITRGRAASIKAARKVERTNEHVRGGIDRKVNMVVGTDIRMQSQVDWRAMGLPSDDATRAWATAYNRRRETLFAQWGNANRCLQDGEGHYKFGGMMWLAARNLYGPDAETAGVIHYDQDRADAYGTKWATYVTVVDPGRVKTPGAKVQDATVFEGRQLDRDNRWTGMYLFNRYPGERSIDPSTDGYVLVPRENSMGRPMAWHWFMKSRGAAQRGMTNMVTVIKAALNLDKFDDAQLQAAIIQAAMAVTLRTADSAATAKDKLQVAPTSGSITSGGMTFGDRGAFYAKSNLRVGPNQVTILAPEDELVMEALNRAAQDPTAFRMGILRPVASTLNMPTEIITKDYTQSTYSSIRASIVDAWRDILAERGLFTDHVPALIADAVTEEMFAKGWIKPYSDPVTGEVFDFYEHRDAYCACAFIGPGMGWVDPLKEALAVGVRTATGQSSLRDEANVQGKDIEDVIEDIGAVQALAVKFNAKIGTVMQVTMPEEDEPEDGPATSGAARNPAPAPAAPPAPRIRRGSAQ